MKSNYLRYLAFLMLVISNPALNAQDWECAKDRDGIRIFTCHDTTSSNKLFKGEIDLQSDVITVSNLLEDVRNFDKWDDDISLIKILGSEPGKSIRYYVQYDLPWPFANRDLCAKADIRTNPTTGERIISACSDPEAVPPDPEFVRMKRFWQKWTITPTGFGKVHLTLEGFADPAGDIPVWLANLAITKAPWNMLQKIREALE